MDFLKDFPVSAFSTIALSITNMIGDTENAAKNPAKQSKDNYSIKLFG